MNEPRTMSLSELDALFAKVGAALEAARARSHEGVDAQFDQLAQRVAQDYSELKAVAARGELVAPPDLAEIQGLAESATARHLQ